MNRSLPLVLAVALFMEHIDSTVISTSLPAIAEDIGTNPIALKLALTAYFVSLAIFIPISGWMAGRFGAKTVFRVALGVFVVGSVMSAGSWSLETFVVSRFVQGMGGAMMTPLARLILLRGTPRSQFVGAMTWLTMPALIGPMMGPPLGGLLTTYASWHWIFLVNVPIGLLGIWLSGRVLPHIAREQTPPLDRLGFVLAGMAAAGVVFGLSVISLPALPPAVGLAATLAGLIFAGLYVIHSRRKTDPLLQLDLFRKRVFRSAIMAGVLFRMGSGATPFLLPLLFQLGFGLTPFQSGLLTFTTTIGALGLKFMVTTILRLAGFRTALLCAIIGGAAGVAAPAFFTPDMPYFVIVGILVASGLLRSLFFTSSNALVFADIDDREASQATALSSVSQQISLALGVAVGGGILEFAGLDAGAALQGSAFTYAFLGVGLIALSALIPILMLPRNAGSDMSGHRRKRKPSSPDKQPIEEA